jgi:hypothetical protein
MPASVPPRSRETRAPPTPGGYHHPMSLARVWTRQLFSASGVALLAPGTLVVALVLLGLTGGFGRLGALGQAFAGPAVPAAAKLAGPTRHVTPRTPLVPVGAGSTAAPRAGAIASTGAGSTPAAGSGGGGGTQTGQGSGSGTGGGGGGRGNGGGGRGNGGGSGSHQGGGSGAAPTSGPPTTAPPPVAHPPTVVDGVVSAGTSITQKVPGAAGVAATQLLQNVGTTVDGLLPSSGHSGSTATSASPTTSSSSTAPAQ